MQDNEEEQKKTNSTKGGNHTLAIFGIWLLFTAIVLAVGFPIVRDSIRQSGVLTLLKTARDTTQTKNQQQAKVWFYLSDGSIREFAQVQGQQGGSVYHDTFENLLSGPGLLALKEGAISSINAKTTLLGITLSNKVLYIDLSKHFLESQNLKKAYEQLKRTGKGFSQIKDIVLLIEGAQAALPDDL